MIDFIRLLKDYNIPHIQEVDGWINVNCPLGHSNGKRGFKGGFNLAGSYYHCWACQGSSIEIVISELLHLSLYETRKVLEEYSIEGSIRQKLNKKESKAKKIILPGVPIENKGMAYLYLNRRHFDPNMVMDIYKCLDGTIVGNYSFRIIIPIYYKKQLVSFQARSIYSKKKCDELGILRYKNYPIELSIVNPKHILYNLDNCLENWIVVVEGVFDCWRLGPKNVSATMGTSMSNEQLTLLASRFKKVIFLFDNEKPAQDRAREYAEQLSALGIETEIFNPEFEHDPGDYDSEEELIVRKELQL